MNRVHEPDSTIPDERGIRMRFDPTTVDVATVTRLGGRTGLRGRWPCTHCGERFSAEESWGVSFRSVGDVELIAVVCPRCAQEFAEL